MTYGTNVSTISNFSPNSHRDFEFNGSDYIPPEEIEFFSVSTAIFVYFNFIFIIYLQYKKIRMYSVMAHLVMSKRPVGKVRLWR